MCLADAVNSLQVLYIDGIRKLKTFVDDHQLKVHLNNNPPPLPSKLAQLLGENFVSHIPPPLSPLTLHDPIPSTPVQCSSVPSTPPHRFQSPERPSTVVTSPKKSPPNHFQSQPSSSPPKAIKTITPDSRPKQTCTKSIPQKRPTVPTKTSHLSNLKCTSTLLASPRKSLSSSRQEPKIKRPNVPALAQAQKAAEQARERKKREEERKLKMRERQERALRLAGSNNVNAKSGANDCTPSKPVSSRKIPISKGKTPLKPESTKSRPTPPTTLNAVSAPVSAAAPKGKYNNLLSKMREERKKEEDTVDKTLSFGATLPGPVPSWACDPELEKQLEVQKNLKASDVFGVCPELNLGEIFGDSLNLDIITENVKRSFGKIVVPVESPLLKRR
ncbi:hypothetical protein P9112_012240 [Eukaryota sp. TZLM1-RC]